MLYTSNRLQHSHRPRGAFSRVDVVAVLFMLTILAAIVVPGMRRAQQTQIRVACRSNLREIGGAYHRLLDVHKGESTWSYRNSRWVEQTRKFLKSDTDVFRCPLQKPDAGKEMPEVFVFISEGFHQRGPMGVRLFSNNPRVRRFQVAESSSRFVLELESAPPDFNWDWKDLEIAVQPEIDGSVTLTAVSGIASPFTFDLLNTDGNLLIPYFSPDRNSTCTIPPAPTVGYGVNGVAWLFSPGEDSNKVLVAEYERAVCRVMNLQHGKFQVRHTDFWPRDVAPRHNGMLNVLFQNGVVKTLRPADIDPRVPAKANTYWLPKAFLPENEAAIR